jgi:hypothetical protein
MSYTGMMQAINEYDPNGADDGGVVHPDVPCIMLHGCVFKYAAHRCKTLGMCGCAFAYDRSHDHGGYTVVRRDNLVREALLDADMVRESDGPLTLTKNGQGRSVTLRAHVKCGIPRPNATIDLQRKS